jgi:nicotinamide riboside transporter PnuC
MPEFPLQRVLDGIRATHPAEWLAVISGVVYVLFIMARHRVGWIFGALSSVILMVLAARARLPMNALLQFSYVLAAAYGWWSWSRAPQGRPIGRWHWRGHAVSLAGCVLISQRLSPCLAATKPPMMPPIVSMITPTVP